MLCGLTALLYVVHIIYCYVTDLFMSILKFLILLMYMRRLKEDDQMLPNIIEQIVYANTNVSNKFVIKLDNKFISMMPKISSLSVQLFDKHNNLITDNGLVSVWMNGVDVLYNNNNGQYGEVCMDTLKEHDNTYTIYNFVFDTCFPAILLRHKHYTINKYLLYLSKSNGTPYIQNITINFYFTTIGKINKIILSSTY